MTTNGARGARHARRVRPARFTTADLVGLLSGVIGLTSFVCLLQLRNTGVSAWSSLWAVPIALCSLVVMTEIVGVRENPAVRQQIWIIISVSCITLLGVIRILLPVSLDADRKEIWTQPILVVVGLAVLFLAMNLTVSLPSPQRLGQKIAPWIRWLILSACSLVLIYLSLPRRAAVLPAQPRPADSLVMLLAVAVIALLAVFAVFATRVPAMKDASAHSSLLSAVGVLPTVAVVGFFGLTRDLGVSVELFCASIAVLVSSSRSASTKADSAEANRAKAWSRLAFVSVPLLIFAAGCVLVVGFGRLVLRIPQFGPEEILGYSDRQPTLFSAGKNLWIGQGLNTGFSQQWHGAPGSAPDVLALIGHETGVLGLVGVILVFALLCFSLQRMVRQIGNWNGAALAWGLIVFLIAQGLLAAETLIPGGVPVGEGPPLLSGGWADYLADLIAIGIVIGLSRRDPSPCQPVTVPVQPSRQRSQPATPV